MTPVRLWRLLPGLTWEYLVRDSYACRDSQVSQQLAWLVSSNGAIFITFVLLGLLTIILGRLGKLLVVVVPAPLVIPVPVVRLLRLVFVLEIHLPVTLKVVLNLIYVEGHSWVEWINVLIVRELVMHRVWEDVPINLFEFIIREDFAGPKRVLAATAQLVEFLHATDTLVGFSRQPSSRQKFMYLSFWSAY